METILLLSLMRLADSTTELLRELGERMRPETDVAVEEMERSFAIADVLALAVFADGEMTSAEWQALEAACAHIGRRGVEAREAARHWQRRAAEIGSRAELLAQIRGAAEVLSHDQRVALFEHVHALSRSGAGIPSGESSYRSFRVVDPDALLDVFSEGLGVARDPSGES